MDCSLILWLGSVWEHCCLSGWRSVWKHGKHQHSDRLWNRHWTLWATQYRLWECGYTGDWWKNSNFIFIVFVFSSFVYHQYIFFIELIFCSRICLVRSLLVLAPPPQVRPPLAQALVCLATNLHSLWGPTQTPPRLVSARIYCSLSVMFDFRTVKSNILYLSLRVRSWRQLVWKQTCHWNTRNRNRNRFWSRYNPLHLGHDVFGKCEYASSGLLC